jgi:hypothetical protein
LGALAIVPRTRVIRASQDTGRAMKASVDITCARCPKTSGSRMYATNPMS